jgi:hypothetical protein
MENKSLLQTNFLAEFRVQTFVANSKPAAATEGNGLLYCYQLISGRGNSFQHLLLT